MAKIYGLFGSMTGKVADVVMAVRNGEQIARKYQPVVANPQTAGQTASRAKLKLMSQLSAVMAKVIAMPRVGSVSSRNQFVKENYPLVSYSNNQAEVTLTGIQLTKSVVALPGIQLGQYEGSLIASIATAEPLDFARVVFAAFVKQADGKLRYAGSKVVTNFVEGNGYRASFSGIQGDYVIYAYAVRDNNERARTAFGNLQVVTAETIAKLIVTRTLLESDVTLTETQSAEGSFTPGQNAAHVVDDENRSMKKK